MATLSLEDIPEQHKKTGGALLNYCLNNEINLLIAYQNLMIDNPAIIERFYDSIQISKRVDSKTKERVEMLRRIFDKKEKVLDYCEEQRGSPE